MLRFFLESQEWIAEKIFGLAIEIFREKLRRHLSRESLRRRRLIITHSSLREKDNGEESRKWKVA